MYEEDALARVRKHKRVNDAEKVSDNARKVQQDKEMDRARTIVTKRE